jgi:hypothetical protein
MCSGIRKKDLRTYIQHSSSLGTLLTLDIFPHKQEYGLLSMVKRNPGDDYFYNTAPVMNLWFSTASAVGRLR